MRMPRRSLTTLRRAVDELIGTASDAATQQVGSSPINASRTKLLLAVLDTLSDLSCLSRRIEWIQAGSRFLQKALMDKDPNFSLVFPELLANLDQLATDMFGNYLIQVT